MPRHLVPSIIVACLPVLTPARAANTTFFMGCPVPKVQPKLDYVPSKASPPDPTGCVTLTECLSMVFDTRYCAQFVCRARVEARIPRGPRLMSAFRECDRQHATR